ncbi:type II toxin-antitoxin system PemK/MazF family toxin [Gluconobacter japonicus]|uniref:type II toxin-antitoxin system PemK/MazF family toxin n=1 Tax=Gluconobacter japonicus TaxID=376620 RepID=UPI0024ADBADA|nr:type II toxin-antitoxin system PemK/MazF family toxin [Gluconobacter japonicus]MDI6654097.1 type II toxin-antitoxin system PemK/MazF family toxin [Gluconobacter japonicus]
MPEDIVLADWRGDAMPKEPNKRRPSVVVVDELFLPEWPNLVAVPLTDDENFDIPDLAVRIDPTADHGSNKSGWAVRALLTSISKHRLSIVGDTIHPDQLTAINR